MYLFRSFFCLTLASFMATYNFTQAQVAYSRQPPSLGVQVIGFNFKHIGKGKEFPGVSDLKPGLGINYLHSINESFDWVASLSGTILEFTSHQGVNYGNGNKKLLLETDLSIRWKPLRGKIVSPFLRTGGGTSYYGKHWGAFLPSGAGVQFHLSKRSFLLMDAQYRLPLSATQNHHVLYSIGIAGVIGNTKNRKPNLERISKLLAPKLSDADGDGIFDKDDKCVTTPGVAKYKGCPIPDTDGDGINDNSDSCITVPGTLQYNGCPPPPIQKEAVANVEDNANYSKNDSLIEKINASARKILFLTGSYRIDSLSYPEIDSIVTILKKHPNLNLIVEGHTDDQGTFENNQRLSEQRANAVTEYLFKKGHISPGRLEVLGYGQTRPVADNSNENGRTKNRRVEMKLRQ